MTLILGLKEAATEVIVRRSYDVPAQRIYDAWTDPAQLRQWLTPDGVYAGTVRVGGTYELDMRHGDCGVQTGTYLRLDPPHLIEFTWSGSTSGPNTLVRIEITDLGSACEMVLTHSKLPEDMVQGFHGGWAELAETLAKQVGSA